MMTCPEIRSPSAAKARGRSSMDSSKDILRVGTLRSGLLVWVTVATSVIAFASRSAAWPHGRINERFTQILYSLGASVDAATDETPETKGTQTRRAILQAAIIRFGRDGFRATSVADIARDASVGGTVAYAYFPNKEALFLAAVDEDAAGVIHEGLATVLDEPDVRRWHDTLIFTLVDAVERHPLARRLLAGLEPEVTVRVLEIPALNELRKACTEMLRNGQAAGLVRPDIDPAPVA